MSDHEKYPECVACAEQHFTGGSWGTKHTCGKPNVDVTMTPAMSLLHPRAKRFFPFIRQCAKLLGIADTNAELNMLEDGCWLFCFDDGLDPADAVAKYRASASANLAKETERANAVEWRVRELMEIIEPIVTDFSHKAHPSAKAARIDPDIALAELAEMARRSR